MKHNERARVAPLYLTFTHLASAAACGGGLRPFATLPLVMLPLATLPPATLPLTTLPLAMLPRAMLIIWEIAPQPFLVCSWGENWKPTPPEFEGSRMNSGGVG